MKKKILGILLVLVLIVTPVSAETIKENDSNFLAEDNLIVETNICGNLFAAGQSVKVKSDVDGATFAAGSTVSISNNHDFVFAAGQTIELDEVGSKDVFIAGANITIINSNLRDIYVSGESITIKGGSARNIHAAGAKVSIEGDITGNVEVAAEELKILGETVISGKLSYNEDAKYTSSKSASVGEVEKYKSPEVNVKINPLKIILAKFIEAFLSYVSLLLVAFILLALYKKFYANVKKLQKVDNFELKALGIGLLGLICVPILGIILLITIVGIPLSLILFALYFVAIYLTAIPSTYYVGTILFKNKIKNDYAVVALSLLIYYVARLIPFAGGILAFASLIFGLGIIIYLVKPVLKKDK
jgi:hypothetical protein